MGHYNLTAYAQMHEGIEVMTLDLKSASGLQALHQQLANTHVLLTSFRPSALHKLGLDWQALQAAYPQLSMVSIVGSPGLRAEEPGHDLTYLAENGLVNGLDLPATLYADMAGSLMASEAVLQAVLLQRTGSAGSYFEVALSDAAATLALPRAWGLTLAHGAVGGAHAGYRIYPCLDGRVAAAALEPHFAMSLCKAAGVDSIGVQTMLMPSTHSALAAYFARQSCQQLEHLALTQDIPLYCMPA
jgi:crotonobetainyl-CoA:carnitine CoA-transferase CaiB-like acyl-CoA transferase